MIDHEKLKQTRAGGRRQGGWKPRNGDNLIRILPPKSYYLDHDQELENLAIQYRAHFFKVEGRPADASICLAESGQPCPACDMSRMHRKAPDPGLRELAKDVRAADMYLFNMLDHSNLQAGIQRWSSNWTCWDQIMDIAGNAAWGNLVDPADGVDFLVTLIPKGQSKSGFNSYSAKPQPQRSNVMAVLEAIPDWRASLDLLEDQIIEPKEPAEIIGLLNEMGFPQVAGEGSVVKPSAPAVDAPVVVPVATQPQPIAVASQSVAVPTPITLPAATPVEGPVPVAVTSPAAAAPIAIAAPTPAATTTPPAATQPQSIAPTAPAVVEPPTTAPANPPPTEAPAVHYDPGPHYTPKVLDSERPPGAPRCYTDYDPKIHQCTPCPVATECQMVMLGIKDE